MLSLHDALEAHCRALRITAKPRSAQTFEQRSRCLTRYFGESFDVTSLSPAVLDGFIEVQLATGTSRQTVNGLLATLKAALNRSVERGLMDRVPCRVKLLKIGRRIPRVLTSHQVGRLVGLAPSPVRLMLLLAADAGLRHQEILHLRPCDVDLRELTVRVSSQPGWSPKSHHEREVPLTQRLVAELRERIQEEGIDDWLFPGYGGGPLQSAHSQVRAVFKAADLYDPESKPGLHQLRRTWATLMLGVTDIETVRQLGGWRDIQTVQGYVSSTTDRKRAAIAALAQ